ncbi:MAG TPA: glutamine-hydrolyzing GMP synthase subunit GuaA [Methanobacteriales archaeon]|nr:MAG: GMP synthase [glutamine-hydrolyzing] subunit B [Methanobacteriaceae archaeon 41_258]MBC7089611.1 glutamine-hydrolyzing GMP synthase subunit GuaA [Methanobacteriaceae archaeon]MBC7097015.1 glutamine-hydrolyzing GMP synthase subunit GuaA [Methanobacteriales archaeon]HIH62541.1 glutamine-hydrolyzing GMP synthase subunit GuaA [Methanobacteriales archaeon]
MFKPSDFIKEAVEDIKERVGDGKAIIALSGGVDSSVASVLASRAIGERLVAVFVDHGLLRESEVEYVRETFSSRLNLRFIDASDRFLKELKGVTDPEEKRRIIGRVFIEVFEEVAEEIGAEYLVQGTIAPDWIESEGRIKSHHNVTLPHGLVLKIVEPLRELYKDEVRILARELGLPDRIIKRQPFPGPGLAVRIIGEITPEKIRICRRANAIVEEEIIAAGLDERLWQYFAVLTDTMATGVKGDMRDFGYLVVLRMVESIDAMTARVPELPWDLIRRISKRITSEIPEVTHVALSVSDKPPSTIEFA